MENHELLTKKSSPGYRMNFTYDFARQIKMATGRERSMRESFRAISRIFSFGRGPLPLPGRWMENVIWIMVSGGLSLVLNCSADLQKSQDNCFNSLLTQTLKNLKYLLKLDCTKY